MSQPAASTKQNYNASTKGRLADLFYETETEYYGLPPFGLLDEIGEGIVTGILGMFERCPKALSSQIDFLSQDQIEAGCEAWAEAVEQSVSRTFELFESYSLKNVLLLPETFKLPHRPAQIFPAGDCEKIDQELNQLMAQLQTEKLRQHQLKIQRERLTQEEAVLASLESQIDALNGVLAAHSIDNLSGTLSSLGGQIEALKAIVSDTLEASSNAFAFDDGELPKSESVGMMMMMEIDTDLPMDKSVMNRLLELEIKSCGAIGSLSDIKALL